MEKKFNGTSQVEQFLGITKGKRNNTNLDKNKDKKTKVDDDEQYIKFTGLIKRGLKKKLSHYCIDNNLKEYEVVEKALEQILSKQKQLK
ncbi:MAG: hypothetical protein LBD56_00200 [Endomicrobium sp.]|jgi:hypothetical protein|nr:hypothetical protein [Endomicrobium sp.]